MVASDSRPIQPGQLGKNERGEIMINGDNSYDYIESDAIKKNRTRRPILGENRTSQIGRFGKRLEEVIGDESVRSFARRAKLAEGTLRQYISGNRYPDLDFLAVIADTANVNLLWLATGEGPKQGESMTCAGDALDEEALARALEVVEEVGAGVPLGKRARLLKLAYTLYIRSGSALDQPSLKALVKEALSQTM